MVRFCVAIPTYNERENIPLLLNRLLQLIEGQGLDGWIIIVDDSSHDSTGVLAEEFARRTPRVKVIHRPKKSGLGSAYVSAFRQALNDHTTRYIFEMDADLSHDPEDLVRLLEQINDEIDVVIGSRYISGGRIEGWPLRRLLVSRSGNFLARILLGLPIRDVTSGFRGYDRRVLEAMDLSSVRSGGYAFQVEMLYRCKEGSYRITEVPIRFTERKFGKSKLSAVDILEFLGTVVALFWR